MKKLNLALLLMSVVLLACAKKEEATSLEPGSNLYEFVESLALKVPSLDPDKNMVIVRSNDFELTVADIINEFYKTAGHRLFYLRNQPGSQIKQSIELWAQNFADRRLLVREAQNASITVDQAEIDSTFNHHSIRFGGEEKYKEILANNDVSIETLKEELKINLMIQHFLDQKLADEVAVSEDEMESAYSEDKTASVRHILLSTEGQNDSSKAATREKMEELLQQARNGEDFAELARQHTEDPGSKASGGLYQDFERGTMVKPFEEASFSVPVGEVSDIVETQFGFHIIKVVDRKKETRSFEEVRPELEDKIKQMKYNEARRAYIDALREEAGVKISDL